MRLPSDHVKQGLVYTDKPASCRALIPRGCTSAFHPTHDRSALAPLAGPTWPHSLEGSAPFG